MTGWYVFATVWCTSVGFFAGLCVGWFWTEPKLTEQEPLDIDVAELENSLVRVRAIDLHPISRN